METNSERRRRKLTDLCAQRGITKVAENAGLNWASLDQIIKKTLLPPKKDGTRSIKNLGDDAARKIERAEGLGEGWFDLDDESISEKVMATTTQDATITRDSINLINNPDFPSVRRAAIKLSAGATGFGVDYIDDDEAPIVFQRKWFERNGYKPSKLLAVRVCNGSMEPGLYDGDTVIINTSDANLKDGEVYAMNYEGELVIKRLVRDAGQWWLASDNPDQRRYPRKVCGEGVFCIGRIVHKQSERI